MASNISRTRVGARYALAGIRGFNGAAALFAPTKLAERLGVEPGTSPATLYALRLFGVRTIYAAGELLLPDGPHRRRAVRFAPVIHLSDTLTAATVGLPKKSMRTTTIISAVNSVLAILIATGPDAHEPRRRPWKR